MGKIFRGLDHLCAQVWKSDRGDFELRILGRRGYVCVAEFSHCSGESQIKNFAKFQDALFNWFSGKRYQEWYKRKATKGFTDPRETWREIKKHYGLSDDYDSPRE